jgi:hypothetical protein
VAVLIRKTPIVNPAAWKGAELAGDESWIHQVTDADIEEIDAALASVHARDLKFPHFTADDFPLPTMQVKLQQFAEELETGRGFLLLRGLPVQRYSDDEIRIVYYGIGLNMGCPVGQNPKGDLLGLVMNVGDLSKKTTRVYETNAYLPYHTDPSDVVGLLCLRKAKQGGLSSLVSSASVYNRLLETHPEFLALFYRPMYYAHLGKDEPGLSPIFSYNDGKLSCRYLRQYIELGHEIMGLPLSRIEIEALDLFDSIIHDESLRLDMMLEPGDLQFANNYAVMHSRTEFEDHEDTSLHRKMLRLWLKMPNARQLAADFPGRNGFPVPPLAAGT